MIFVSVIYDLTMGEIRLSVGVDNLLGSQHTGCLFLDPQKSCYFEISSSILIFICVLFLDMCMTLNIVHVMST